MALAPEVDSAIEDVTNEAIVTDKDDSPVELELSNLEVSESIKNRMRKSLIMSNVFSILINLHIKSLDVGTSMVDYFIIKLSI